MILPFSSIFTIRSLDYVENPSLPKIFLDEELTTRFFQNSCISVLIFGIAIIFTIVTELLWYMSLKVSGRFKFWMEIIRRKVKYSVILRGCLVVYTPISFATSLQFCNINFDHLGNRFDSAMAIVALVYMIVFPLICLYIINTSRLNLENEETKNAFETLYDSVHTNALFKKNFVIFYLIRKALWPALIVVYADDPLYQIISLIILVVMIITLLFLKRPYKRESMNTECIFAEFLTLTVLILIAVNINLEYLGSEYLSLDIVVNLGWAIVAILSSVTYSSNKN